MSLAALIFITLQRGCQQCHETTESEGPNTILSSVLDMLLHVEHVLKDKHLGLCTCKHVCTCAHSGPGDYLAISL